MSHKILLGIKVPAKCNKHDIELLSLSAALHLMNTPEAYYTQERDLLHWIYESQPKSPAYFFKQLRKFENEQRKHKHPTLPYKCSTLIFELSPRMPELIAHYLLCLKEEGEQVSDRPSEALLEDILNDQMADYTWMKKIIHKHFKEQPGQADLLIAKIDDELIKVKTDKYQSTYQSGMQSLLGLLGFTALATATQRFFQTRK